MRISELPGWPPVTFQAEDGTRSKFTRKAAAALRLTSATFIPDYKKSGDLVLFLRCRVSESLCTARIKISNPDLGRQVESVLAKCKGLSLAQAGNRIIPQESTRPSGTKPWPRDPGAWGP